MQCALNGMGKKAGLPYNIYNSPLRTKSNYKTIYITMQRLSVYLYACRNIANTAAIPPKMKKAINHHKHTKPKMKHSAAQYAKTFIAVVSISNILFIISSLSDYRAG